MAGRTATRTPVASAAKSSKEPVRPVKVWATSVAAAKAVAAAAKFSFPVHQKLSRSAKRHIPLVSLNLC